MNAHSKTIQPSRRDLVVGVSVVGGALLVGCSPADLLSAGAKTPIGAFGPFIKVAADGAVTVICKHIEFGQGSHAGLAAIVAEELDADWTRVGIEFAPANAKIYANSMMGAQGTGGSSAIANSWDQLRKAGAATRAMFVQAAAAKWKVPPAEITVKDSLVSHAKSGRSAGFGDLVADAGKVKPPESPALKDPAAFTLIGTNRVRRKDSLAKSTGAARYTQDVRMEGMLTAVVAHAPRFGAKVKSFDDTAARKVAGVVDVIEIPTGVAIVARDTWSARQGREALTVVWDESGARRADPTRSWRSTAPRARARVPRTSNGSPSTPRATPPGRRTGRCSRRPMTSPTWPTRRWSRWTAWPSSRAATSS